jgi:hypothetical protein
MNNNANQAVWRGTGDQATQDNPLGRVLKLGLDVHYRQVTLFLAARSAKYNAATGAAINASFITGLSAFFPNLAVGPTPSSRPRRQSNPALKTRIAKRDREIETTGGID